MPGKSTSQTQPWLGHSERCGRPAARSLWEARAGGSAEGGGVGADPCGRKGQKDEGIGWTFQRGMTQQAQGRLRRGFVGGDTRRPGPGRSEPSWPEQWGGLGWEWEPHSGQGWTARIHISLPEGLTHPLHPLHSLSHTRAGRLSPPRSSSGPMLGGSWCNRPQLLMRGRRMCSRTPQLPPRTPRWRACPLWPPFLPISPPCSSAGGSWAHLPDKTLDPKFTEHHKALPSSQ